MMELMLLQELPNELRHFRDLEKQMRSHYGESMGFSLQKIIRDSSQMGEKT